MARRPSQNRRLRPASPSWWACRRRTLCRGRTRVARQWMPQPSGSSSLGRREPSPSSCGRRRFALLECPVGVVEEAGKHPCRQDCHSASMGDGTPREEGPTEYEERLDRGAAGEFLHGLALGVGLTEHPLVDPIWIDAPGMDFVSIVNSPAGPKRMWSMLPRPVDASWIASQPLARRPSMIRPTCSSPTAPRCQRSTIGDATRSTTNVAAIIASSIGTSARLWKPTTSPPIGNAAVSTSNTATVRHM